MNNLIAYKNVLVNQHATLMAVAAESQRRGQTIDPNIISHIRDIENFARANYNRFQIEQMMRQSDQRQHDLSIQMKDAHNSQEYRAIADKLIDRTKEMTRNMGPSDGLTPAELSKYAKGEKITRRNKDKHHWNEERIAKAYNTTPQMMRRREKALEHLKEIDRMAATQKDYDRFDKTLRRYGEEYGISKDDYKSWRRGGDVAIELERRMAKQTKDLPDEVEYEPSESDKRRAQIYESMIEKDPNAFEETSIHESYFDTTVENHKGEEVPDIRAHVAMAAKEHGW